LVASLPLLLNLLIRTQVLVQQDIDVKVKAGRQRLGAGPEHEVRRNVEAEVLTSDLGLGMVELLKEVGAHPAVDDAIRRDVEVREFGFWRKLIAAIK
jgi:superkiller protein 3